MYIYILIYVYTIKYLLSCDPKDCIPQSVGFPRQEYWSRLPFPSPGDLPDSGIKPKSPALLPPEVVKVEVVKVDSLLLSHQERPQ